MLSITCNLPHCNHYQIYFKINTMYQSLLNAVYKIQSVTVNWRLYHCNLSREGSFNHSTLRRRLLHCYLSGDGSFNHSTLRRRLLHCYLFGDGSFNHSTLRRRLLHCYLFWAGSFNHSTLRRRLLHYYLSGDSRFNHSTPRLSLLHCYLSGDGSFNHSTLRRRLLHCNLLWVSINQECDGSTAWIGILTTSGESQDYNRAGWWGEGVGGYSCSLQEAEVHTYHNCGGERKKQNFFCVDIWVWNLFYSRQWVEKNTGRQSGIF